MSSETTAEVAARLGWPWDHVEVVCTGIHDHHCMFCDGGLTACSICMSFEGATTTQCPGRPMTAPEADAVYAGRIDYRAGEWLYLPSLYCPGGFWQTLPAAGDLVVSLINGKPLIERADEYISITTEVLEWSDSPWIKRLSERLVRFNDGNRSVTYAIGAYDRKASIHIARLVGAEVIG